MLLCNTAASRHLATRGMKRWIARSFAAFGVLLAAGANAAVTVNKAFSPASMTVNGTATATITLGNTGGAAATGSAFTDNLPSGLVVASPSNISSTCGGTASATAGSGTVSLSGGTIPASGGSCAVTVAVTSAAIGNYTNTIPVGGLTSSQGSNGAAASATLAVLAAQPITGSYAYAIPPGSAGNLKGNGSAYTVTLTLKNTNTIALTNVGATFSLQQPQLGFATPNNLSSTCGTVTLNAAAGTGTLSGGTIPANGNCQIVFSIFAAQPNNFNNGNTSITVAASSITDDQGVTNTGAITSLIGVQTGARITKAFSPSTIVSGATSTLTLTISNYNASTLTPITVADSLPTGMVVAPIPNASTTCGGVVTASAGAGSVSLANGSLPAVALNVNGTTSCTIIVDVVGTNGGGSNLTLQNTIPIGNFGGVNYPAASASLIVLPNQPLAGSNKTISIQNYAGVLLGYPGSTHTLTITLDNTTSSPITVTSATDDLTTMGAGFVVAPTPNASTTCAGGTVSAPAGGTTVTLTGGTIPASNGTTPGTCTITVTIYFQMIPALLGQHTNTIPAGNIVTSAGSNTVPLAYTFNVYTPLNLSKTFSPASVNPGGKSTLTLNLSQSLGTGSTGVDPLTNVSASDTLPAGVVIAAPPAIATTCSGANVTAPAGGSTVSFSGVNLTPGAPLCTIKVDVVVPQGTSVGTLNNIIPPNSATTDQGFTNSTRPTSGGSFGNGAAAANLTVANATMTINKTFTPANVAVGTVSQLAVAFVNNNPGNIAVSQATLTDNLPLGMVVAATPAASFTGTGCTGATITAAAGASTVGIAGASIAAGSTCTLNVNVVASAAGNLINTIPASALSTRENVTNSASTTATLAVSGAADLSIAKSDGVTQIATGTTTTYTVTVSNGGPNNVIGAAVTDTPPSGMTITSWTCAASSGAGCGAASGSGAINDTIDINVGSTVTYTVHALIAANFAGGTISNSATVTQPALVTDSTPGNNTAIDTDTVAAGVVLALTKTDGSASYTPGGTATYTVTVANTGAANATQVNVADALPSGVTLSGTATCTAAGSAICGTVSGGAGQSAFGATGATVPAGAANKLTFTIPVTFAANLSTSPLVNIVNATDVPSGATGSASDSDTRSANADVSIVKSGPSSIVAGAPISYTLVISNAGPSTANGATFADTMPASITGITATCGSASGGAACPASVSVAGSNVSGTIPTLPVGGSVTITINGTTAAGTGTTLSNTASVSAPSGTTDPTPGNNTSVVATAIRPVISITKSADTNTLVPGGNVNYTITVTNAGPVAATGTLVTDPIATGLSNQTWTCVGSGGATCTASGSGAVNDTLGAFPSGGAVTYVVSATIDSTPPTNITNTASAALASAVCAPANTASPCTATASLPAVPQVGIAKSADTMTVVPGGTIHYTVVVSNTGIMPADNTPVSDPVPTGIASQSWTCTASGGAVCANASGSGAIGETLATFPSGSFVTYNVTATVSATPPGVISNTATANPAVGTLCTPGNTPPPCTATANVTSNPQVSITKTADTTTVLPGGTIRYTVTVTNTGPVAADGTQVNDPIPTGIASQAWTCATNAGASCTASGTGAISDTLATFPAGSFVTYTVTATVSNNPPASIDNTATADPPTGGICTPGNTPPPCSATVSASSVPQLGLSKTADVGTLTPGGTITYTVVVSNTGAAAADGTPVTDPVAAGIASQTWVCSASGGATCTANGSGAINDTVATFPPGSFVTYTITATVAANPPAYVSNTASATPPNGGVCAPANTPGPCTATATVSPQAQIGIAKTADTDSVVPSGTIHFKVTVSNTGSVAADGTAVSDPVAAGIASQTWSCTPSGGATCTASGTGAIADTIAAFPPGSYAIYTIAATVSANPPANLSNTATATPLDGVCTPTNTPPPCSATASVPPVPQIGIVKTSDTHIATPNGTITYTVVVSNSGAVAADGTSVADPMPTGIASQTWTCVPNAGATCAASGTGAVSDTIATFPAGSFVTYTVVATVGANPPSTLTNTASATPPSGGVCSPGNTAPPCTSTITAQPVPLVSITKTANSTTLSPGGSVQYTVTVANAGSAPADGATVSDPIAVGIASQTWTCAATGGATCAGGGTGAISDTIAAFPAGSSVTYTVNGILAATPPSQITNTATATPPSGGLCVPSNAPPCVASSTLPVAPVIGITKTADTSTIVPGGTVTYTVTVSNLGSSAADGTTLSDPLAGGIDAYSWTCSASGGATCTGSGSGAINDIISPFPAASEVTYTIVAQVSATPPATISNTASATPPAGGVCSPGNSTSPCTASASISSLPLVSVAKAADVSQVLAGGTIHYTVTVTNAGSADAGGTTVSDPIPTGIASQTWTCAASGGASCAASGSGGLSDTLTAFPSGAAAVYSVTAIVSSAPPARITNTASATPPSGGLCAPGGTATPCTASTTTSASTPVPQLQISKTANTDTLQRGGTVIYTIAVTNPGSVAVANATVNDPLPTGLTTFAWTCVGGGGATCPNAAGSGAIAETVSTIPAGGMLAYTVTATIAAAPPSTITNTATVAAAAQVTCAPSGTPAPCAASAAGTVQVSQTGAVPAPLSSWMLWTLMLTLFTLGAVIARRSN